VSEDPKYVRLEERLAGMAASTTILHETAARERSTLRSSLEDRRVEVQALRTELAVLREKTVSNAQVRAALIAGVCGVLAAVAALLRSLLG
jgi:L-serine deaminase